MEKMNAFVEEELVNHEGVVEEIVDQNENENLEDAGVEIPNEGPTQNPGVEEPSKNPTGDPEGKDYVPEFEP
jgi:hypothetical protein